MDLRDLLPIQTHLEDSFPQLVQAKGYDHNIILRSRLPPFRQGSGMITQPPLLLQPHKKTVDAAYLQHPLSLYIYIVS